MMQELAHDLAGGGYAVTVLTTQPPRLANGKASLACRRFTRTIEGGVTVLRAPIPFLNLTGPLRRALAYLLVTGVFFFGALLRRRIDCCVVYSTPFFLGTIAAFVKRIRGVPYIFNLHDPFPDNIVDLGLLKNRLMIHLLRAVADFTYREARYVTVYSEANRHLVERRGGRADRVVTMPDWIDTAMFDRLPRQETGRQTVRIGYTGVLGFSQDLRTLIDAAKRLEGEPFEFWIVGDGIGREAAVAHARRLGTTNVVFRPFVPLTEFPALLAEIDVGYASYCREYSTPTIPAKLLGYMAARRPVLGAFAHPDPQRLIAEARCGICVAPGAVDQLVEAIRVFTDAAVRRTFGDNGRRYVERHHSREACTRCFGELIAGMTRAA